MTLVEVLVSGSIVLGAATGSLGIWARTAHSSHSAQQLLAEQRAADGPLLAVQAELQALAAGQRDGSAPMPAEGCLAPTAPAGLTLTANAAAQTLTATAESGDGQPRTRVFDLAVYGLCAPAGGQP
jgi:hypothetical protein